MLVPKPEAYPENKYYSQRPSSERKPSSPPSPRKSKPMELLQLKYQ